MPCGQVHLADGPFVIQRRKPVDSLHRTSGQPALEGVGQRVRIPRVLDLEDFYTSRLQMLCQRGRNSAFIRHDYHAATRAELHSRQFAQIERWTEVGYRHSSWNVVCRIETRDRWTYRLDHYRS